jgi:glc operon protein GlcG
MGMYIMMKFTAAAAFIGLGFSSVAAHAQTPSPGALPSYGPGVSLEMATKMIAAAVAEAKKSGLQEAIAIVDSGGRLVAFARMDNTQLASIDIAMSKAVTANSVKRPTKALQDSVAPGTSTPRMAGLPGIVAIDGGLPIVIDGKIAGAIGAAGSTAPQDGEIAAAGLAAVAK